MSITRALQAILAIALVGIAFSGVLTYRELSGAAAGCSVSAGGTGLLLGLPVCVYGLGMYAVIALVAGLALAGRRGSPAARELHA